MTKFVKTDPKTFRFQVNTTHYGPTTKVLREDASTGFSTHTYYYQGGVCIGYKTDSEYWLLGAIL